MKPTRRIRRKHQTRRKRRGGKILGEGEHATVIDPAIPCKDKDTIEYVSKVFKSNEEFQKVIKKKKLLRKLEEIDPNQEHFLYPSFCEQIGDLTDENKNDGVTDETKQYSYLLKRGGQTLEAFLTGLLTKDKFMSQPEVNITILTHFKGLFESIKLLHRHNILHGDLHTENVIQMPDKTFRLIDFDSSALYQTLSESTKLDEWNYLVTDMAGILNPKVDVKPIINDVGEFFFKPDSHPDSRTGGAAHRSGTHTPYRSRRGKGSSRR